MRMSERYKSNAFDCVRLAHGSSSSESKVVLLMMARAWIKMGEMAARAAPEPQITEAAQPL
jgi:hypothetical protein